MTIPITHDIFKTTPPADGYDFPGDNQTVKIFPGITVFSEFMNGVRSGYSNSTLLNDGHIESQGLGSNGVMFSGGANGKIINRGSITGFAGAVMNELGNNEFDNYGALSSNNVFAALLFATDTTTAILKNHGTISSKLGFGVDITSNSTGGVIQNYHNITANYGIFIDTPASQTTTINNHTGGVIRGTTYAIDATSGGFVLHNSGLIKGNIIGFPGTHETIVNPGTIKGTIHLDGNAIFIGTGGRSGEIDANGGNDVIKVGVGKVFVSLGAGSDIVTAGPGRDTFFFSDSLSHHQVETFKHFNPHLDSFELSANNFVGLGLGHLTPSEFHIGAAVGFNAQIVYTPSDGALYFDPFGVLGTPIHIATINPHGAHASHLTAHDFVVVS